jgi:hypothetical protein
MLGSHGRVIRIGDVVLTSVLEDYDVASVSVT